MTLINAQSALVFIVINAVIINLKSVNSVKTLFARAVKNLLVRNANFAAKSQQLIMKDSINLKSQIILKIMWKINKI